MAAQLEAAAQSGDPQAWFEGSGDREAALDWHDLAEEWGAAAVDRVSSAVTYNLSALATEIRETGELGALLTKAAAGQRLTAEEKRKVRAQLVDLAKAVPALAIFAAPGGTHPPARPGEAPPLQLPARRLGQAGGEARPGSASADHDGRGRPAAGCAGGPIGRARPAEEAGRLKLAYLFRSRAASRSASSFTPSVSRRPRSAAIMPSIFPASSSPGAPSDPRPASQPRASTAW